MTVVPL